MTASLSRKWEREEQAADPQASAGEVAASFSRKREREEQPADPQTSAGEATASLSRKWPADPQESSSEVNGSLSRKWPADLQESAGEMTGSLSRLRERARVRARALRHGQTDAEALLWSKLRSRQMLGLKFRRQHPLGSYFADFACVEIGLIVELDGGQHGAASAIAYDRRRSGELVALGFEVLRFWDNEVLTQTEAVLEKIWRVAQALTPTLSRKRERE